MSYNHDASDKNSAAGFIDSGIVHGMITGVVGLVFTGLLQAKDYLPSNPLVTVVGVVISFYIGKGIWRMGLKGAERFGNAIYVPSGDSTAYTPTFSHIEALEIKGDLDAAAAAWESAIQDQPGNAIAVVRAADFHLRARKDAPAALTHYLRARQLNSGTADLQRYVQQKIVDLYLGPLADRGRAMAELRRLIDAFPNTREADGARAALMELKQARND